jgi:RNA polymerase sigma-70 factor (ECF subfamily)
MKPSSTTLREIFNEHAPFVWRTLRHLGVREADLEDLCQEVFLVVHRKLPDFEWRSALQTWIYGICLRTASDHRRRAYMRREVVSGDVPEGSVLPSQEASVRGAEARQRLLGLLDALDEEKRQVFVLYEIEGLDMKDIAKIIGCPLQTGYSRLHAARALLAQGLGQEVSAEVTT